MNPPQLSEGMRKMILSSAKRCEAIYGSWCSADAILDAEVSPECY